VHPPAAPAFCRVTVLAPGRRVDLALPVDVPMAELNPLVLELLGEPARSPARPDPWRFTGATGAPLPPGATLDELGVLDGETLRLGPAAPPPPAPVFDDPVDALAALAPRGRHGGRGPAVAALGVTLAASALLATARAGGDGTAYVGGAVALGGLAAVAALVRAATAARRAPGRADAPGDHEAGTSHNGPAPVTGIPAAGSPAAALVPAYCAVPLAAAAGWVSLPGAPGAAHLLLAVVAGGIAAALGQVAVRRVAPALVAVVLVAVLAGAAAVAALRFGVGVPALSAAVAAAALSAGPLVPRAVLRLAGLPRPVVPADAGALVAADGGPDLLPAAELAARARLAQGQLAGLAGGLAVSAALAALPTATSGGWAGPALASVVVAVLLLRARGFADPGPARTHLAAGIVAGVGLVGLAAVTAGPAGQPAGALVLLGTAAVGAAAIGRGTLGATGGASAALSPVARRALDIAEGVLTAAAVPLAVVASGAFALVRAL
jgi:WXG100 protein secretion system (Wss), protein YukD